MNDVVYITGHKNPDSDSICAAIAYAEFKNKTSDKNYIPVRLGELNRETSFILSYFGIDSPKFIDNVKLQVSDLNIDRITPVSSDVTLKMAWNLMKVNNVKSLPVVDKDENLNGMLSVSNLTESYMNIWDNMILGKSEVTIDNLVDTLTGEAIHVDKNRRHFYGKIAALSATPEILKKSIEEGDIVITGEQKDYFDISIKNKASLIIISNNGDIDDETLKKAKDKGVTVMRTPYDTYTACRLISQAVPIKHVLGKDPLVYFSSDDYIDDIKGIMGETRYRSYPVVDDQNKVIGTISRFHLISGKRKEVILVDHNEKNQSVKGLDQADILEIIDHHRVADVATNNPIYFRNEPVGSTSTIIANIFFENGIRPAKYTAGLLAAAIISDTLLFKSPTSTNIDKVTLSRLSQISGIDTEEFAFQMFKYGTSLADKTPEEILYQDFKEFTYEDRKIGVSQVYTMDAEALSDLKNTLIESMEKMAKREKYFIQILIVTDIYKEGSELIVVGKQKDLVEKAFDIKLVDHSAYIPGILSRKKQVIPPISTVINRS